MIVALGLYKLFAACSYWFQHLPPPPSILSSLSFISFLSLPLLSSLLLLLSSLLKQIFLIKKGKFLLLDIYLQNVAFK